jgi:hypothetical protein
VVAIIDDALRNYASNGEPSLRIWAWMLGIAPRGTDPEPRAGNETLRALSLLADELDRGVEMIPQSLIPSPAYQGAIDKARAAIAYNQLTNGFSNVANAYLNPEVMGMLRLCAHLTPPTEVTLSKDDLSEFDAAVVSLETAIAKLSPSDTLGRVLSEQLRSMRRARLDYQIAGVDSLRQAAYELDGALMHQVGLRPDGSVSDSAPALDQLQRQAVASASRLSRAARHAVKVATAITLLGGAVDGVGKIGHGGQMAVNFVSRALGAGEVFPFQDVPRLEQ